METNKLIAGIVAAAIAIIVLAGVLMPALSNATTTEEKFVNDGLYTMAKYDDTASISAIWEYQNPYQITVNGEVYQLPDQPTTIDSSILCGTHFVARYNIAGTDPFVQVYGFDSSNNYFSYRARVSDSLDMSITVSSGQVVFDYGSNPKTVAYDDYIFMIGDGDYVMKNYNEAAYVLGDSEIFASGHSYVLTINFNTVITGTIDDGFTRTFYPESALTGVTFGDMNVYYTENSNYKDLYKIDKFDWSMEYSGNTATITYSQYIVPAEVTAEKAVHFDPAMNGILAVIPLLILVGVLLAIAAAFIIRRE